MRLLGSLWAKRGVDGFYVTTPIYYVNASPHIGHLYSSVIADAACRWRKLLQPNSDCKLATGTDEHGTKIQQAALSRKVSLPDYCATIAGQYKELANVFSVGYSDFIRTSEGRHEEAVRQFWTSIAGRGYIYQAQYAGWYCVSDETFLVETQLKENVLSDGTKVKVSAESGHPVEWTEEQNYMFKLNHFEKDLRRLIQTDNFVRPKKFQKILLDMLDDGLPDVSVSRPSHRVHWGITVPGDSTQTVYVWLDALVNYLTAAGYPDAAYKDSWPVDLHVIGKDILKFHGIYWPAFLMAADIEPPRSILCHSHWTVDGEKMSKSRQNVVNPMDRKELYGTDGFRYFLLREGVAHSDGNYSETKVLRVLNSELADTLGNLLSRCCGAALNPNNAFPAVHTDAWGIITELEVTRRLVAHIEALPDICHQHYSEYNFYKVVDATIATLHAANLFFETTKPWQLKKRPETVAQLDAVLHIALETLRVCGIVLSPIVPNLSENILNKINVARGERDWGCASRLSWSRDDGGAFRTKELSSDKLILFRRIVDDDKKKKVVAGRK